MEFLYDGRKKGKRILFADCLNTEVIRAAHYLNKNKLAQPVLLGSPVQIREFASQHGMNTTGLKVRNPLHNPRLTGLAKTIFEKSEDKEISLFDVQEKIRTPLWYGMALLEQDAADVLITATILQQKEVVCAEKLILQTFDAAQERVLSALYILKAPDGERPIAFADCHIQARPSAQEMAGIALDTAKNFGNITTEQPRVAILSFSTAGSAEHEMIQNSREAARLAKEMNPSLCIDGEVQFDAAFVPKVAAQKMPDSCLQGKANVFIFPSLNAANNALYLARDLAGYKTIGPILQGTVKTVAFLPEEENQQAIVNLALAASRV